MKIEAKTEAEMGKAETPWPETMEQLVEFIESCIAAINAPADENHEDTGGAYGRCIYAMSHAAVAAFHYVAKHEGVSGFQASCADLDFIRRIRSIKGPFILLKLDDCMYPQYDLQKRLPEFMEENKGWLCEEAKSQLELNKENPNVHPKVRAHWEKLAKGEENADTEE
jgi:hypothetical protein